ncbi:hemolysin-III channel protein-like protein Izh2 [Plenodomus tracheiphilus IPT5]|uniref:Hemolysin-III channel protein-like protein Izh2 n=1 Tax=Plenodomus tracheiphilus IPT5 TaxID=1408161 RepID=A0A6A7ANI5_9PLEO|nr:hemolysin-III channel protein-like protein Izh2 [Plenodomus tracheiphilus IPT5]
MDSKAKKPVAATTRREDAPSWMRGDEYIKTGYRRQLNSVHRCVLSLLYLHNEFVNVWSHLAPGLLHAFLLAKECHNFSKQWDEERYVDQMIVWQYIISCILCLLFSAGFHTLTAHSPHVANRWLKIDYLGIILNTAAGCTASTYFGLRHHPNLQLGYIASSVVLGLVLFSIMLAPGADGEAMKLWRAILFATFFASGFVPMIHASIIDGVDVLGLFPLVHAIGMGLFYGMGVIFYITRFPEKYFPEKFDIWGASHQIFHILVVMGQVTYITGLRQMAATFGPVSAQIALESGFGDADYGNCGLAANVCMKDALWGPKI